MIKDIKVMGVIDKGKVVRRSYLFYLEDTRGMLNPIEKEIPDNMVFKKDNLDLICKYEDLEKVKNIKNYIESKINNALYQGIRGYRFSEIGWNLLKGEPMFAFSNCSMTKRGITFDSYATVEGFDLIVSDKFQNTEENARMRFLELTNILKIKLEILYPIFAMNIASLLNQILGSLGKAPAMTMWLDGNPGSGKTLLAYTLGSFINKNINDREQEKKKIFSAFGKPVNMVDSLSQHQGLNFILDDVKAEKVPGQRDKSNTCVDVCIRFIEGQRIAAAFNNKQRALLGKSLNAGAIITGEYMDIYKSSIARIAYMDVNNFANSEDGSRALKNLQDDPYILTDFMAHFIKFLCTKYSDNEYWDKIIKDKDKMWEENKKYFYGVNCSRLANNLSSLQIIGTILHDFSKECGTEKNVDMPDFVKKTNEIFKCIMKKTEILIQEQDTILLDAFRTVLTNMQWQEEDYICEEAGNGNYLYAEPLVLRSKKDALLIRDINFILSPYHNEKDDSNNKNLVIICKLENLQNLLYDEMRKEIKSKGYTHIVDLNITNGRLRKAGIIFGDLRKDGTFNNQFEYPSYDGYWNRDRHWNIVDSKCVLLNTDNKLIKQWVDQIVKNKETVEIKYIYELDYEDKQKTTRWCNYDIRNIERIIRKVSDIIKKANR